MTFEEWFRENYRTERAVDFILRNDDQGSYFGLRDLRKAFDAGRESKAVPNEPE